MNLNKTFLIGRLTADPQLRTTTSGQSVTTFSMATNRVWNDKAGKKQEDTEFHNIVVWGRQAEVASQFLKKGGEVYIEGRLQTRGWQDKQGNQRKTTEIICERMQFGARPSGQGYAGSGSSSYGSGSATSSQAAGGSQQWSSKPASSPASDTGAEAASQNQVEEIPIIDVDAEDIKAEDLPF